MRSICFDAESRGVHNLSGNQSHKYEIAGNENSVFDSLCYPETAFLFQDQIISAIAPVSARLP